MCSFILGSFRYTLKHTPELKQIRDCVVIVVILVQSTNRNEQNAPFTVAAYLKKSLLTELQRTPASSNGHGIIKGLFDNHIFAASSYVHKTWNRRTHTQLMHLTDIILQELVDMHPVRSPLCIIISCIFIGNTYLFNLFVSLHHTLLRRQVKCQLSCVRSWSTLHIYFSNGRSPSCLMLSTGQLVFEVLALIPIAVLWSYTNSHRSQHPCRVSIPPSSFSALLLSSLTEVQDGLWHSSTGWF